MPIPNNPSEAQVTERKNGPGEQHSTPTQAQFNKEASGVPAAAAEWGADMLPADFEAATESDPRGLNGEGVTERTAAMRDVQEGNQQQQNPISKLKVLFRGEEREYDETAARNMVQQFLARDNSPMSQLTKQLQQQLGVQDEAQVAQIVARAMAFAAEKAVADRQGGDAPAGVQALQQQQQQDSPPAQQVDVDAALSQLESENGIRLPAEMRSSLATLLARANDVAKIAEAFPAITADVNAFKDNLETQRAQALASELDSVGARVAQEEGLNDEEDYPAYEQYVAEQNQMFPGYAQTTSSNPKALEKSLRDFAKIRKGQKLAADQAAMQQQVQNKTNLALGDTSVIAARGGPAREVDFNRSMMDSL